MKKFTFSLMRVLDFKNQLLLREKNELARRRQQKQLLEQRLAALEQEFQQVNDEMTAHSAKGLTVLDLQGYQYQLDSIRLNQEEAQAEILKWDARIAEQLQVVLDVTQEVSGLEKLEERQREEYNRLEAKASEENIAEFVSGKIARSGDGF